MAATKTQHDLFATRRADVIEDVVWLTDCGEHPENVAKRLGYSSAKNLTRLLERWGEPSLARRMRADRWDVAA